MADIKEVTFRPKSPSQKPNCLFCQRPATHEVVYQTGWWEAQIRCCDSEECIKLAAELAIYTGDEEEDAKRDARLKIGEAFSSIGIAPTV